MITILETLAFKISSEETETRCLLSFHSLWDIWSVGLFSKRGRQWLNERKHFLAVTAITTAMCTVLPTVQVKYSQTRKLLALKRRIKNNNVKESLIYP